MSKEIARKIGYKHIDSGAMYRAVTLHFIKNNIDITNTNELLKGLDEISIEFNYNDQTKNSDIYLNGENIEDKIRSMEVSDKVS